MLGIFIFSSRYGYAANVEDIWRHLFSCVVYHSGMRKKNVLMQDIKREKCVKWDSISESPVMSYKFLNKYPMKKCIIY